jgi:hypothetical protein
MCSGSAYEEDEAALMHMMRAGWAANATAASNTRGRPRGGARSAMQTRMAALRERRTSQGHFGNGTTAGGARGRRGANAFSLRCVNAECALTIMCVYRYRPPPAPVSASRVDDDFLNTLTYLQQIRLADETVTAAGHDAANGGVDMSLPQIDVDILRHLAANDANYRELGAALQCECNRSDDAHAH